MPVNNFPVEDNVHRTNRTERVSSPSGSSRSPIKMGSPSAWYHPPGDNNLKPQATSLTRDSGSGALARATVRVADIQHNVDRVEVMELEPEPEWPEEVAPLAAAQLVYLGMPGSFDLANLNAGSRNAGISPGCANPSTRRSGGPGQGGQQDTEPRRLSPMHQVRWCTPGVTVPPPVPSEGLLLGSLETLAH